METVGIKGFESYYTLSDEGMIWSIRRGHRISYNIDSDGYAIFHARIRGKRTAMKVHRLVAQHFIPNPNNYPCVNHKDGNKLNNIKTNLEWCSHKQNMQHAHDNGLTRGTFSPQKLTEDDVRKIKSLLQTNITQSEVARQFNVTFQMISMIKKGKTWKNVV